MRETITQTIDAHKHTFYETSQYIGNNPELGNEEFKACEALTTLLHKHGFSVETGMVDAPTAFIATYESNKPGATIGFMCEYDALPEIGHACGHNLIGTQGVAAAIGLKEVLDETGGTIKVFGTPAEETKGAKVTMADAGLFDELDVALMAHPSAEYVKSGSSLAMDAIQFAFRGRTAHAAAAPEEGINALDAVIQTFNSINALRQHVRSDVRIHGIIKEGGQAANIVPDYAVAQFYARAKSRQTVNPVTEKVIDCARAAALSTGAKLEVTNYEYSYDDMKTNEPLSNIFTDQLVSLGIRPDEILDHEGGTGSLDMGNVSQRCPAIHPYIRISHRPISAHTVEFRDAALSSQGFEGMMIGAKALALTGYEVLTDTHKLHQIKSEFVPFVRS
ncbi:M20 family metallopeptidase [Paenalkalicoccus suaedae]|uniref:Peptidase M20 domain-containing protein 2 n=1 Tax=Paenalkalicoccus suaedae TaxID=2592382 RepID=A0A859FJ17_9BACI|nr:M20 family metallopeptidase [Paenalkalicoccus suaedae]QKS72884.1 M20 family metallopeptidase [Paenalkalicoccus suaedae]